MRLITALFLGLSVGCSNQTPQIHVHAISATPRNFVESVTVTKTLAWNPNDPAENISSYNIYEVIPKSPSSAAHWGRIGVSTIPQFSLENLVLGSLHVYSVRAVNFIREGPFSTPLIYRVN